MLVSELRALLKKYSEDDLRILIVEMYKAMPKQVREDKSIDELLKDMNLYLKENKRAKDKPVNFNALKPEIEWFLANAYEGNYFKPNQIIHKKERPKWRFKVKSYIKSLESIPMKSSEGEEATDLLIKIFKMLNYACRFTIFNTQDAYNSAKISKSDLLENILIRTFDGGISYEKIKRSVVLVVDEMANQSSFFSSLDDVLIEQLKTRDTIEMALKACLELKKEGFLSDLSPGHKYSSATMNDYYLEHKINAHVRLVVKLKLSLHEYEDAIKYFYKHYKERNKEVAMYVLLWHLYRNDLKDYWLREYETGVKKGIKPRKSLQETYDHIIENNQLPDTYRL